MEEVQNESFLRDKVSVVILAAGKSERMGQPKFNLVFDKKHTFLEEIIAKYSALGCEEIVVVVNSQDSHLLNNKSFGLVDNIKVVLNKLDISSRFYSLQLGLKNLKNDKSVLLHNVDNPFINTEVTQRLIESRDKANIIAPAYQGKGGHPILIDRKVSAAIVKERQTTYILSDFFKQFRKEKISVKEPSILININTPEDYELLVASEKFKV